MFWESLIISLSMYSALPMPRVEWREDNMRWSLGCLPLVGLLCGGAVYGWSCLALSVHANSLLFACLAVFLPLLLSGGLHMDGFLDASDAIFSRRDREKRLQIMKDPHCGPFAVLSCAVLIALECGAWSQLLSKPVLLPAACIIYICSRSLTVTAGSYFPYTPTSTLGVLFASRAARGVRVLAVLEVLFSMLLLLAAGYLGGGLAGLVCALAAAVGAGWLFVWYRRMTNREFGGITGDLLGYFIELAQLCMLLILALASLFVI